MSFLRDYLPKSAKSYRAIPVAGGLGNAIESPVHLKRIPLTAAQIILMFTTPQAILPAPASNKAYLVKSILFRITRTSTQFTGGGTVTFQYHTTTTSVPHQGSIPAAIVTGVAGTVQSMLGPYGGANALVVPAGEGIDITNGSGVFAAGTGTAEVLIEYSVLTLG